MCFETNQDTMYVQRNMEARSCNHRCSGKAMRITQPESVYCICRLRYPTCNAHAPYCHLCYAPLYNIFPHISWTARFL